MVIATIFLLPFDLQTVYRSWPGMITYGTPTDDRRDLSINNTMNTVSYPKLDSCAGTDLIFLHYIISIASILSISDPITVAFCCSPSLAFLTDGSILPCKSPITNHFFCYLSVDF
mmetsp:Transcript_23786/g.36847  ORF Transcript_23786/g.36847 Transcript_23786/m.36847 type:complete len:115 (+) Transcript_23786:64-408(+)